MNPYAVHYILHGKFRFTIETRVYDVNEGDLVICSSHEQHSIQPVFNQVYSSISVPLNIREMIDEIERLWKQGHYIGNFLSTPVSSFIEQWFREDPGSNTNNSRLARELLLLVLAEGRNQRLPSIPKLDHTNKEQRNLLRLMQIKQYIKENYQEKINPDVMEEKFGLTWSYIATQFSRTFGLTPMQLLTKERIKVAKELALQTSLSFGEIAHRVGYNDIHSFGKMFKKNTGLSLSEYCVAKIKELDTNLPRMAKYE